MVNPAIIAGLVAGYTVGAVVTAFFASEEPAVLDLTGDTAAPTDGRASTRCAGALRRNRPAAHCLVRHPSDAAVTTRRR